MLWCIEQARFPIPLSPTQGPQKWGGWRIKKNHCLNKMKMPERSRTSRITPNVQSFCPKVINEKMSRATPTSHGHRSLLCTMVHNAARWCTMQVSVAQCSPVPTRWCTTWLSQTHLATTPTHTLTHTIIHTQLDWQHRIVHHLGSATLHNKIVFCATYSVQS